MGRALAPPRIYTYRDMFAARDSAAFARVHRVSLAKRVMRGVLPPTTAIYTITAPVLAFVNLNRWLAPCPCGLEPAVVDRAPAGGSPPLARCFGCGAVLTAVVMPDDADAIEAELVRRPWQHRNWQPGETLARLRADNIAHGV